MLFKSIYSDMIAADLVVRSRWLAIILALLCFVVLTTSGAVRAQDSLATPAIDASLFKDGAVQERETQFASWYLRCQEIVKLNHRVCNLLSRVVDKDGQGRGSILLATDDKGQPAILIALDQAIVSDRPIQLESSYSVESKKKPVVVEYKQSVASSNCDKSCKFVFYADPKLVFAMNEGRDISVKVFKAKASGQGKATKENKDDVVALVVRSDGFAGALKAAGAAW